MFIRDGDPKLLCPISLRGTKPYPCVGEKCAAFLWLDRQTPGTSKDDPLTRVWGKPVGYCSMGSKPNAWQLEAQYPKHRAPWPPKEYLNSADSDDIEI
jgi:hypothetical protein